MSLAGIQLRRGVSGEHIYSHLNCGDTSMFSILRALVEGMVGLAVVVFGMGKQRKGAH